MKLSCTSIEFFRLSRSDQTEPLIPPTANLPCLRPMRKTSKFKVLNRHHCKEGAVWKYDYCVVTSSFIGSVGNLPYLHVIWKFTPSLGVYHVICTHEISPQSWWKSFTPPPNVCEQHGLFGDTQLFRRIVQKEIYGPAQPLNSPSSFAF